MGFEHRLVHFFQLVQSNQGHIWHIAN